ncbi:MAG: hypothetical protein ACHP7N_07980 [Caulobacterales bacterium]
MHDLDRALAQIDAIRVQVARGVEFRGYGPAAFAATGVLALLAAVLQARWMGAPAANVGAYLALWIAIAAVSAGVIGFEMVGRSRRMHSGLADEMIRAAVEQFLPAALAGGLITLVLVRYAPQSLPMLPGLWQIVFSLGVFASCRFLPRAMLIVGVWYLGAGLFCLAFASGARAYAPWTMGGPFGLGQLLVAAVLRLSDRGGDE